MRRAVVTGSQGFLGSHIVKHLRRHGVHVTTLGRGPVAHESHIAMGEAPWCLSRLTRVLEDVGPDAIFHLAGGQAGTPAELHQLNAGVAITIMQALRDIQAHPLLVCCGSAAEYGAAISDQVPICETATCAQLGAYGASKLAQTNAALAFAETTGTRVLVARIFNPIGPNMPTHLALGDFARQIAALPARHGRLQAGNLHVLRDFIDIDHVVSVLWNLAHNPAARGVVNICSGEATELNQLVETLIDVSGKDITIETDPKRLRRGEFRAVVGSTALLARLGAAPSQTNYPEVVARVWQAAEAHWAGI
jgi:GDP-4-dehydro-6-deoxy-D-mannose reductase